MGIRLQPCNALSQPERLLLWGQLIPFGMRLSSTCALPYCGNPEHFCLIENKNAQRKSWVWLTKQFRALPVGEFIEIEKPEVRNQLHMALAMGSNLANYSLRTSADGKKVRIYKVGSWENYEETLRFRASLPVLFNGWLTNIADRIAKHPPICFFGFLGGSTGSVMHKEEAESLTRPCSIKGCPFPRNGGSLCHRHEHFTEYVWSMKGQIDKGDLFSSEKRPVPLFSMMRGWEIAKSFEYTKFLQGGQIGRGEKLSDEWWKANVAIALGGGHWSGPQGGKGWGKKKIRKAQRKRPAGWHGSHPEQKPIKVEREAISDLPQWAPPAEEAPELTEEIYEELYFDENEERDLLVAEIEHDFDETWA